MIDIIDTLVLVLIIVILSSFVIGAIIGFIDLIKDLKDLE